jgi:hypothetical protein
VAGADETLSRREADEVLRRAVELHQRESAASSDGLALSDVRRLASEIGIPAETVERALVQVRQEALALPSEPPGIVDRLFGPALLVAARTVPGPITEVTAAIDAMLRGELFRIERNLGDSVVWENPESLLHRARRLFDVGGRMRLGLARRVTVRVEPSGTGLVHVRLEADLEPRRTSRVRGAMLGLGTWTGIGALVAVFIATMPVAIVPAAVGTTIGASFAAGSRRSYHRDATATQLALDRFLDYLERERVPK